MINVTGERKNNSYLKYQGISFGPALDTAPCAYILLLWKYINPKSTKHAQVQYKENLEWPQLMKTKSPFYLQKILKSEEDYKEAIISVSLLLVNWSKLKWVPLWTYCNHVNNNEIPWNDHSNRFSLQFLEPRGYKLERCSDDTSVLVVKKNSHGLWCKSYFLICHFHCPGG